MNTHILSRAAVGAAASLAALAPLAGCSNSDGSQSTSSGSSTSPPEGQSQTTSSYEDGTYTARGIYGGVPSYMDFTVSLEGGVVTDVESELMPENNDTSRGYQERFAAAVPDEVEGQPIADLEVGTIAGASGCADGFNDALDKIRDRAESAS
ncbi:hypothetical protein BFG51_06935 [Dietzia alimentaria]|nr:hypothetical protein BFG51_06935 [Dietzia alimentaria]